MSPNCPNTYRGCAIDILIADGGTTLMHAATNVHTHIAKMLLLRGTDITLTGNGICGERDALGHTDIVELIEREGCWRRRRSWMVLTTMLKDTLRASTAPIDSSAAVVYYALAMDEICFVILLRGKADICIKTCNKHNDRWQVFKKFNNK